MDKVIYAQNLSLAYTKDESIINGYFTKLSDNGFDMDEVYDSLLKDGLKAFEMAFEDMLNSIK
jgi:transaldolase